MDAVVYVRISQDRNGDGAGVGRQETDARALANVRGWTVTSVIVENDTSAAGKKTRPGFERLLQAVEDGAAQVVIAWALDRLTRNRRDTLRLIEAEPLWTIPVMNRRLVEAATHPERLAVIEQELLERDPHGS